MSGSPFPYRYWAKILGLILLVAGVFSFFLQHQRKGVFDFNELAVGFSWGFVFIFFSREKTDDEMMRVLKFKALARAIIASFFFTHLYNYVFLNWQLHRPDGMILSISAYQFVAISLSLATAIFHYLKYRVTQNADQ
jgi:hypothetical protein